MRRSRKENEHRVPIHPLHVAQIPPDTRGRLIFEHGYGEPFGTSDSELAKLGVRFAGREEILAEAGVVLLAKPLPADLAEVREDGILWGWPHCVQQAETTQVAIDRRLTLIAWEAMFLWKKGGVRDMHVFYRNNEMAGYAAVIHALGLVGLDAHYGGPVQATVLSFGSVSRGAIRALRARGVSEIKVFTQRPAWAVHDKVTGCRYARIGSEAGELFAEEEDGTRRPMADVLTASDVIVNCILQDPEKPLMFLKEDEVPRLKPGALIIDVSCDEDMGFPTARPTSFAKPTFALGRATYYAVDHTPSHLWRSASWELSRAVLPFIDTVLGGPSAWEDDATISRAIEIQDGCVRNEQILRFQQRGKVYPHPRETETKSIPPVSPRARSAPTSPIASR